MHPVIRMRLPWLSATLIALCGTSLPTHASDVVTVKVHNLASSAQNNTPFTFGHVFRPGDVPAGTDVVARRVSDGASIPLQVDKKASHNDGSLRHAVLTARVPLLNATEILSVGLAASARSTSRPAVQLTELLASSFSARVALQLGDKAYTADARNFLQNAGVAQQWLSGPLVSEWLVGGAVVDASGNPHPHLAAYFHVRAYAGLERVRVDVIIENGWTFKPSPTMFSYGATIRIGGRTLYTGAIRHNHHARWRKTFWWGSEPEIYVEHDKDYLQATGAVPRYPDLRPSEDYLNSMRQGSTPMAHGDLTQRFPLAGAQHQIGPLPRWTTAYVLSTDRRAFNNMLANDDHAGSYSVHYRDEAMERPVSIGDYPNLTTNFEDPAINGGIPVARGDNPNVADAAHQPSIGFVSYLVTGDYFYLEEMQFWSSWNHLNANPLPPYGYRKGAQGIFGVETRGQAWSLRNLAQAAYATPDDHPYKQLLVASVHQNIDHNESLYSSNPAANRLGALKSYSGYDLFAPWMDDFYTWTMGYLVDLGFDARELRGWKARFPVGRMGIRDYCYIKASTYRLIVGPDNNHWWPDFATLYQQNFGRLNDCPERAAMDGYPEEPDGYPANLRPALAVAVDAHVPGATEAWERLVTSSVQPDFSDYANWAVVPRGRRVGPLDGGSGGNNPGEGVNGGGGVRNESSGSGAFDLPSLIYLALAAVFVAVRRNRRCTYAGRIPGRASW